VIHFQLKKKNPNYTTTKKNQTKQHHSTLKKGEYNRKKKNSKEAIKNSIFLINKKEYTHKIKQ